MSVEFDKVWVIVAFLENACLVLLDSLSGELQTSFTHLINVLMVIALCEVGL